jgi:uncharacterized protein YegL
MPSYEQFGLNFSADEKFPFLSILQDSRHWDDNDDEDENHTEAQEHELDKDTARFDEAARVEIDEAEMDEVNRSVRMRDERQKNQGKQLFIMVPASCRRRSAACSKEKRPVVLPVTRDFVVID